MGVLDILAKASGYDKGTNMIKWFQTVPFPAFHIRNIISGDVQNYERLGMMALNPKNHKIGWNVVTGADKGVKFKKWSGTSKELRKILNDNFGMSSRYMSDLSPLHLKRK